MRRWTESRAPIESAQRTTARTASAFSAAAGSPTRRLICWASLPASRCGLRRSITTAGSACRRRLRHRSRRSASTAACRFRWRTSRDAETILLVGSNLAETMPPVMQYFEAQKKRGGSLIVVDPRLTPTAAAATLHLQITPGTDGALANGLMHIAIKEGLYRRGVYRRTDAGFRAGAARGASFWPERVERITGIPEQQLRRAAGHAGPREDRDDPHRARTRAAKPGSEQRSGVHQPRAGAWARRANRIAAMAA